MPKKSPSKFKYMLCIVFLINITYKLAIAATFNIITSVIIINYLFFFSLAKTIDSFCPQDTQTHF